MAGSGFLPFDKCQELVQISLECVVGLARNIEQQYSVQGFTQPIQNLEDLNRRVQVSTGKFLSDSEIDTAIRDMLMALVSWNPVISNQLLDFWKAQVELSNTANAQGSTYDPLELANQSLSRILATDTAYQEIVIKINSEPNEKLHLYGLFYVHIVLAETTEHTFRKQFENLLTNYNLQNRFDAKEIFSVESKVAKGSEYRTDVRAIRDALSHFRYEIVDNNGTLCINFDNHEEGYNFTKSFTKVKYQKFVQNFFLLHKIQAYLIWLFIASATLNSAFKI